jgi:N-acetyl-1-D-myo-inositol-2-amino-2-deoxy-alpha-D-glucopyranoside deacetylase
MLAGQNAPMLVLVVVAHPDDETFGCGSVLAHAAAAGHRTAVLCATRGEAGESRVPTDDLAAVREAELREAARILGVGEVRLLDHGDSDMIGEPRPGTLAAADPAAVAAEVRAVIEDLRPDIVITLDGADGHRDHAVVRDATLAAVDATDHPPGATYLWCVTRSRMARWAEHLRDSGAADSIYLSFGDLGTPDEDVTTVLDVSAHLAKRWEAMRAHASQANPYEGLSDEALHQFLCVDSLQLVRGDDLLAE